MTRLRDRPRQNTATQHRSLRVVTLVSALGAAQGVAIVTQVGAIGGAVGGTMFAAGDTAQLVLSLLSTVFLVVAITVTSVVVSGAAEVVLTGRVREIALRRLLGSSASAERSRAANDILRRAVGGMTIGAIAGYLVSVGVIVAGIGSSRGLDARVTAFIPSPLLIVALGAQYAATRTAVRRGTKGVLLVPPVQALRLSADADRAVASALAVPPRAAVGVLASGVVLLGLSVLASTRSPLAMLPAVIGGVLSFLGLVSCAHRFVPRLVAIVATVLPDTLSLKLAGRTLRRNPVRTSRAVLGVTATVTLVTTFAVGIATFRSAVEKHYDGSTFQGLAQDVLNAVVAVVLVLTAFLAITAAVALGNAVAFGAWTRRRDTALLRVLGRSDRQTRSGILAEGLLLSLTATLLGLVLGCAYGWIGAQSVFGAEAQGHLVTPVIPIPLLIGAAVGVGALTLAASVVPVRAALRLPPIRAYLSA